MARGPLFSGFSVDLEILYWLVVIGQSHARPSPSRGPIAVFNVPVACVARDMDWTVTQSVGLTSRQAAYPLCASVEGIGQVDAFLPAC